MRKTAVVRAYVPNVRSPFFPFAHLRTEAFHLPNDFSPLSLAPPRPFSRVIIITISLASHPTAPASATTLPPDTSTVGVFFYLLLSLLLLLLFSLSLSLSFSILSLLLTKLSGRFDNRHRQQRVAARQTAHLMNPGRAHGSLCLPARPSPPNHRLPPPPPHTGSAAKRRRPLWCRRGRVLLMIAADRW